MFEIVEESSTYTLRMEEVIPTQNPNPRGGGGGENAIFTDISEIDYELIFTTFTRLGPHKFL